MKASTNGCAIRSLSDLPFPPGLPLLGNMLQLDLPRLHLIFEKWAEEFGSVFTIGLGPKRVFVCSDADLLQTALRERPERYRRFSPILRPPMLDSRHFGRPDEFLPDVGLLGIWRCNHMIQRPTPSLEPVHVFARVAISLRLK